jgi:predicted enzyme related to lactoylglutathione lyase
MSGEVIHFELPAEDVERARTFYSEVFGWRTQSQPGMGYTLLGTAPSDERGQPIRAGSINGGMLQRQPPVEAPVITIHVADIEGALQAVGEHGGRTVRGATPVGTMGFAAYFSDPEGNVLGLWQNAES